MEKILNYTFVCVAVMLMFGASIFVHELGHYWVALWRRLKVDAFAIGFGPKIVSRIQNGIEYSIRWIPAGGFVKLPQMITSEALEGSKGDVEQVPPAPPFSKILVAFAGPAMNVVFAFAIATVIYFTGLPVPVNPPVIGYVPPESPEAKLGIKPGDRIVSADGVPVKSWKDLTEITVLSRTNIFQVEIERGGQRRLYQLTANTDNSLGLKMLNLDSQEHPVVGHVEPGKPAHKAGLLPQDKFVAFAGVPIFGHEQLIEIIGKRAGEPSEVVVERQGQRKTLTVTPQAEGDARHGSLGVVFQNAPGAGFVRAVEPGSAAARAGLQPWDQLLAVAGATVSSPQHLEELAHGRRGQPTDILVLRQGQRLPLSWTPAEGALGLEFWPAPAHPVIASLEKGEAAEGAGLRPQDELISLAGIGVFTAQQATQLVNGYVGKPIQAVVARCGERKSFTVTPRIDKEFKRGRIGIVFASSPMQYEVQYPGPSPWTQVVEVWDRTLKTLGALVHSRQTGVGVKDLSGPPGILAMMAIQVNTDYRLALSFLVLLNINLAVLNLLPIPVLDGGHILLALVERIRRRPLSVRLVEYTTTAFAVLLISFLAYVSFNDIKRMPRFREVFQRSTTVEPSGGQAPQTEAPQPSPAPAK